MGNILSIISSHNKNILYPVPNTEYDSNCRSKENCLLRNKCIAPKKCTELMQRILQMVQKGFTLELQKTPFKERLGKHTQNLKQHKCRSSTELSKAT